MCIYMYVSLCIHTISMVQKEVQYMTILIDQQSTGDGESMKNDSVKGKMTN